MGALHSNGRGFSCCSTPENVPYLAPIDQHPALQETEQRLKVFQVKSQSSNAIIDSWVKYMNGITQPYELYRKRANIGDVISLPDGTEVIPTPFYFLLDSFYHKLEAEGGEFGRESKSWSFRKRATVLQEALTLALNEAEKRAAAPELDPHLAPPTLVRASSSPSHHKSTISQSHIHPKFASISQSKIRRCSEGTASMISLRAVQLHHLRISVDDIDMCGRMLIDVLSACIGSKYFTMDVRTEW